MVDPDVYRDLQLFEYGLVDGGQLNFVEQAAAADYVGVALIEFAVSAFLGAVGAPDGLDEAEQAVTSIAPQAATSTPRQTNVALAVKCRGAREDEVIGVLLPGKPAVT